MKHWRSGGESGQAVILVVVAMSLLLIGAMGLAIDGGQMYAHRQMAQTAADAAAQAAVMSILDNTNASSPNPFPTTTFICTVPPAAVDLRTPCVYARYNGFGTAADTVTVSFPASVPGVTLAPVAKPAVEVRVHRVLKAGLIRFVGVAATHSITARGSAGITAGPASTCVFALSPSGIGFSASGSVNFSSDCGIYVNGGFNISGSVNIAASAIQYVGSYSQSGSSTVSPTPVEVTTLSSDPFAMLVAPAVPSTCTYTNFSISGSGNYTVSPGVYCGGLSISGSVNVTFTAGLYIINGGSGASSFAISGSSSLSGSNVTFFITGKNGHVAKPISVSGSATLAFSAQSTGLYQGLLFYQDPSVTYAGENSFSGSAHVTGSLYFPTTSLRYSGSGSTSSRIGLVASRITLSGSVNFVKDTTGQYTGLTTKSASLIQ